MPEGEQNSELENTPEKLPPPDITETDLTSLMIKTDNLTTAEEIHRPMRVKIAALKSILEVAKVRGWTQEKIDAFNERYADIKKWVTDREIKKYRDLFDQEN